MSEFQPLIDDLYREQVRRARLMTPNERFAEGLRISEEAIAKRHERIRAENPGACEEFITQCARAEVAAERMEDEWHYGPPVPRL